MFCISHGIQYRQDRRYIAESINPALKLEIENIIYISGRLFLMISWRCL